MQKQAADFGALLRVLLEGKVEFILIGGVAGTAHGAARTTYDVDVVYRRTSDNMARLVAALAPYAPYLRGAPPGLPFRWDAETLRRGLNFTLITSLGDLDLLGEVAGGGDFEQLAMHTVSLDVYGHECLCLDLECLIKTKRAAGRPKDLEAIAELELLLEDEGNL